MTHWQMPTYTFTEENNKTAASWCSQFVHSSCCTLYNWPHIKPACVQAISNGIINTCFFNQYKYLQLLIMMLEINVMWPAWTNTSLTYFSVAELLGSGKTFKKSLRKCLQEEEPGDTGVKEEGLERSAAIRGSSEMEGESKTTVTVNRNGLTCGRVLSFKPYLDLQQCGPLNSAVGDAQPVSDKAAFRVRHFEVSLVKSVHKNTTIQIQPKIQNGRLPAVLWIWVLYVKLPAGAALLKFSKGALLSCFSTPMAKTGVTCPERDCYASCEFQCRSDHVQLLHLKTSTFAVPRTGSPFEPSRNINNQVSGLGVFLTKL